MPILKAFFSLHPLINAKTFLCDAPFDSALLYKKLLTSNIFGKNKHFSEAYTPLNSGVGITNPNCKVNETGIHYCPKDDTPPMKSESSSKPKMDLSDINSCALKPDMFMTKNAQNSP